MLSLITNNFTAHTSATSTVFIGKSFKRHYFYIYWSLFSPKYFHLLYILITSMDDSGKVLWQRRMRVRGMRRWYLFPLFLKVFGCFLKNPLVRFDLVSTNKFEEHCRGLVLWIYGFVFSYAIKYPQLVGASVCARSYFLLFKKFWGVFRKTPSSVFTQIPQGHCSDLVLLIYELIFHECDKIDSPWLVWH